MLFWCLLGIAGTKLAAVELLLAPSRCRCCPVEALCSTRLFARRLHPKQAEYGIFNHAQKRIQYSFCSWKNKPVKGMAGGESACLQREDCPALEGRDVFASPSGGRCPAQQGAIIPVLHPCLPPLPPKIPQTTRGCQTETGSTWQTGHTCLRFAKCQIFPSHVAWKMFKICT